MMTGKIRCALVFALVLVISASFVRCSDTSGAEFDEAEPSSTSTSGAEFDEAEPSSTSTALVEVHDRWNLFHAIGEGARKAAEWARQRAEELRRAAEELRRKIAEAHKNNEIRVGSNIFDIGLNLAACQTFRDFGTQQKFFPEANNGLQQYTNNDDLKGFNRLMLAFVLAGYKWPGEHGTVLPVLDAILHGAKVKPESFCRGNDSRYPVNYNPLQKFHARGGIDGEDTQATLYGHENYLEVILILEFRGSETPDIFSKNSIEGIKSSIRDWLGTDADLAAPRDRVCHKHGVYMHNGWQKAWLAVKNQVISAMKSKARSMYGEAQRKKKRFRIMVTGHSLGAALAAVANYDFHCHDTFREFGLKTEVITYGQPIIFFGRHSVDTYKRTVPVRYRIRNATCGWHNEWGKTVWSCDAVTINLRNTGDQRYRYFQPDDDFQAGKVVHNTLGGDCLTLGGGLTCHLLNRYLEGVSTVSQNHQCQRDGYRRPHPPRVSGVAHSTSSGSANWWSSLDHSGYSMVHKHAFLSGLYRNDCNELHCLEEGRWYQKKNWGWSRTYSVGWQESHGMKRMKCGSNALMVGFRRGDRDNIDSLFGVCAPIKNGSLSRCTNANWWSSFDHKGTVSCPQGYMIKELTASLCPSLFCIEEALCCQ